MKLPLALVARKQPGMLGQIAAAVLGLGFEVVDQRLASQADPLVYDLAMTLDGPERDNERLVAVLAALPGVVKVESGTAPAAARRPAGDDVEGRLQAAFVEIAEVFPRIVGPVQRLGAALDGAHRKEAMYRLGQRTGRREYKRGYSLGSPLKLELALRRIVVPALAPFLKAEATDSTIRVIGCPFCADLRAAEPSCDFLAGYVQGMLDAHPGTPGLRVKELRCRACGDPECAFACAPARG